MEQSNREPIEGLTNRVQTSKQSNKDKIKFRISIRNIEIAMNSKLFKLSKELIISSLLKDLLKKPELYLIKNPNTKTLDLNNMPNEILNQIMDYIPAHKLLPLSRVNKSWMSLIEIRPEIQEIVEDCTNGVKIYQNSTIALDNIICPYRRLNFIDCLIEVNKPVYFPSICLCDCILIVNAKLKCEVIAWISTEIYLKAQVNAFMLYDIESNPDNTSMIKSEFITDNFKDIYDEL